MNRSSVFKTSLASSARSLRASLLLALGGSLMAGTASIKVDLEKPGHAIPSTLWGLFFEDINHSADGGLYPELIRNLSFEDAATPENWTFTGKGAVEIDSTLPLNPYNRRSLRLKTEGAWTLANEGYWGMNIVKGSSYRFRLAARTPDSFMETLQVRLVGTDGKELAKGTLSNFGRDWNYQVVELTAAGTDTKAHLELSSEGKGTLNLDMVSLLPVETWKGHGLRKDLAESLAALKPAFLRFPGGCWVEGDDFAHMNHWKDSVGNLDTRTPLWNIWGYNSTRGMGLYEYFQLAEDLGAEPLYCINVGMSHKEVVPMDKMDQWLQDALDVIEYANGPVDSIWGARRAASGHPAPFNLKYLEVGNENGTGAYAERWALFANLLRAKHPGIHLITDTFWTGAPYPKSPAPEIIDEHYYESPNAFMKRAEMYDDYDRKGPKIFIGEYAVTKACGKGNLRGAIGEAAFMTGMERNSDLVVMASYAPLLVNLNHRAWNPDLINFDSSRWYGLPSYYVQKLFAENKGDVVLPTTVDSPVQKLTEAQGCTGVGTWKTQAEFKDLVITTPEGKQLFSQNESKGLDGFRLTGPGQWTVADGAIRQNSADNFCRALVGDKNLSEYTVSLKARKLGGDEGFMLLFHIQNDEDKILWNLGGWGNAISAIEHELGGVDKKPFVVETGRWYELRIEVKAKSIKCTLDGKLMHEVNLDSLNNIKSIYAAGSLDKKSGDFILKVVNADKEAMETDIVLDSTQALAGKASLTVLSSASGDDENSLESPDKVSPKSETIDVSKNSLRHRFPGNSFTVIRIPAAK